MEQQPEEVKTIGRTQGLTKKRQCNYTEEEKDIIYNEVIQQLTEEPNKWLTNILLTDSNYPNIVTFYNWIDSTPARNKAYARTQEVRAHILFNELLTTAKGDPDSDNVCKVQRDRLITDTMKFYISKIVPRLYGDKVDITSNGEAINVLRLGIGIAPPEAATQETNYIDISEGNSEEPT